MMAPLFLLTLRRRCVQVWTSTGKSTCPSNYGFVVGSMAIRVTPKDVDAYNQLLSQPGLGEQPFQTFMERHSEFIPTPFLLGHDLNLEVFISKFPIDTNLITDFTYLTKNSARWRIVFVEIEDPEKKIFKDSSRHHAYSSEFNDALAQVKEWRDHVRHAKDAILRRLEPMMTPLSMRGNPVDFRYMLVYGRRAELVVDPKRSERFSAESTDEIEVVTFDACASEAMQREKRRRNVIRLDGDGYCYKEFRASPGTFFGWVGSRYFRLNAAEKSILEKAGFDIAAWEAGTNLIVNGSNTEWTLSNPNLFAVNDAVEKLLYP
jgi:hypothetical protein